MTDTDTDTFDAQLQVRLRALIEGKGYSLSGLARAMKRSHTWALRKLDPGSSDPRPLLTSDVDEILTFLELPPSALEGWTDETTPPPA